MEAATRKTGGDVTWFSSLHDKHKLNFDIEHWGHTQLQALFLQNQTIGLYYYPELFENRKTLYKTIQQQRIQYDSALSKEHGRIEFVGMSVYKEEASRTVPMEQIYIPLSLIPNSADENDGSNGNRYNPVALLKPGSQHVVLGDPGSGKTILMHFLSLVGKSAALQQRYNQLKSEPFLNDSEDTRLPILITLRRYADAIKKDDNLSLIDYIRANISADFSIANLSLEFLQYHLESGQTILLFDGLDELPDSQFKHKIRKRIQNLNDCYPGNTIIVSSRIYGYQGAFCFDDKTVQHHRIAKLNMAEIEQFVQDWYQVRVERPKDRKDYLSSLLTILSNKEHEAIRELARNPLLLTIIVLVHRIDAVLPDERHVLYQKCTETLLNTWHTWKFHSTSGLHRAKVDRLNMRRMQAIAYWMQNRMGEVKAGQQAVVSFDDLHTKLTQHIENEKPPNRDYAAEDIATTFIEFVQDRAGLLVEIGDREFSFVHLTFQEYLAAGHILTVTEPLSLKEAWQKEIAPHCNDPRWRETIRLLVANYNANESQEMIIEWMLELPLNTQTSLLLGGLYLDGVAAAQVYLEAILTRLLESILVSDEEELLNQQIALLRTCLMRDEQTRQLLQYTVKFLADKNKTDSKVITKLRLVMLACDFKLDDIDPLCGQGSVREQALISLFFGSELSQEFREELNNDFTYLLVSNNSFMFNSAFGCFLSVLGWSLLEKNYQARYQYEFLSLLATNIFSLIGGPSEYLISYSSLFSSDQGQSLFMTYYLSDRVRNRDRARARAWYLDKLLSRDVKSDLAINRQFPRKLYNIYNDLWNDTDILNSVVNYLSDIFNVQPRIFWLEAFKRSNLRNMPSQLSIFEPLDWQRTLDTLKTNNHVDEVWRAASLLLLDSAYYILGFHQPDKEFLREKLGYSDEALSLHLSSAKKTQALLTEIAQITRNNNNPVLRIAHCIRDISYGNASRTDDLKAMLDSNDPAYQKIFIDAYWLPTEEERIKENKIDKKKRNN